MGRATVASTPISPALATSSGKENPAVHRRWFRLGRGVLMEPAYGATSLPPEDLPGGGQPSIKPAELWVPAPGDLVATAGQPSDALTLCQAPNRQPAAGVDRSPPRLSPPIGFTPL